MQTLKDLCVCYNVEMKTFYLIIAIVGILFVIAWGYSGSRTNESTFNSVNLGANMDNLTLTSTAFESGDQIPIKYTCDGDNVNPPLSISNVPAEAKSLVLIVTDPDIPASVKESRGIEVFDHWVVFNIPTTTTSLTENEEPGTTGDNTAGNSSYTGPCPPDREHRYFFRLYALDEELDLPAGATRLEVEEAMDGHIISQAELMGRYERFTAK